MGRPDRTSPGPVPKAAAARLSLYLRCLDALQSEGETTTSSQQLGAALGVTAAQVRKDLGYFGQFGYPGVGYKISSLIVEIRRVLGTDKTWRAALVGVGNLGTALAQYKGFEKQGFTVCAIFDNDPRLVGQTVETHEILAVDRIGDVVRDQGIELGIVAVPADAAQETADRLVEAGIRGIFNFAPAVLNVPEHVAHVSIDLAVQLEQLTFYVTQIDLGPRS